MTTRLFVFLTLIVPFFLRECSSSGGNEEEWGRPIGGTPDKRIELEKNEMAVTGEAIFFFVEAKEGSWDIYLVKATDEGGETIYRNEFYIYDDGENQYNRYRDTLSNEWFTVSRSLTGTYGLVVDLKENNTEKERKLFIDLASHPMKSYGDSLTVIQRSL